MELDDTICYCFHISKRKIVNYIRVHQPQVVSQVSECGGAGTGCGWCISFIKKYYAEQQADNSSQQQDLTPEEYAAQRAKYIDAGLGTPPK